MYSEHKEKCGIKNFKCFIMFLGIYIELKLPNLSFEIIPENFLVKTYV